MVLEFELVQDDLKEANAAHMQGALRGGRSGGFAAWVRPLLMLPVALIGLIVLTAGLLASGGRDVSMVLMGAFMLLISAVTVARAFRKGLRLEEASAEPPRAVRPLGFFGGVHFAQKLVLDDTIEENSRRSSLTTFA